MMGGKGNDTFTLESKGSIKGVRPFAVIGGISSGLKSRERSCPYAFLAPGSGV
jgi:hypothetical protein